jgi:hypothetical protein
MDADSDRSNFRSPSLQKLPPHMQSLGRSSVQAITICTTWRAHAHSEVRRTHSQCRHDSRFSLPGVEYRLNVPTKLQPPPILRLCYSSFYISCNLRAHYLSRMLSIDSSPGMN